MKRKWLIGLLALLMAIATCFGIVACGGGEEQASDEEIANKAITLLKSLYGDGETKASYKVLGQTKVDDNVYDVTWTVSSETENIEDYVKIGTMDESKQITIDISWGENAIEYTLTASVTVGSVTKTLDIKHTIPALGTVYTPSQVLELGAKLTHAEGSEETYYMENGEVAPLTVKGYVVYIDDSEKGGWNSEYKNLNRIYIGDTKDTAKEEALYVYRIVGDEVYLTGPDSIQVGDLVTLNGALEKYKDTIELTYYESLSVTVLGIEKAERTDEEILAAAQNALKVTPSYFSQPGEYSLPVPASGVSVTWELTGADSNVKVENGKIIVSAIPDSETSYTLKATLTYGSAAAVTKEFTIKLGKLAVTHAGTQEDPYTPAEARTIAATLAEGTYYSDANGVKAVYVKGKVVDTGSWSADFNNYNKVYIIDENSYTTDATQNSDDAIQIYRIAKTTKLTEGSLHHGDTLVVKCGIQNYYGEPELGSPTGDSKVNAADFADYTATENPAPDPDPNPDPDPSADSATITFDANKTGRTSYSTEEQVWTQNGITFTNGKGTNTNGVQDYSNPIRCYKNSTVKIEFTSAFAKLVFVSAEDYTSGDNPSTYCTWLKENLEAVSGVTVTVNGTEVTAVLATSATSFEFTASQGQVRFYSITVYKTNDGTETPGEPQTDEEKIKAALDSLNDMDITTTGTTNLETSYNDGEVTFSWATDTQLSGGILFENNVITVTALPEADVAIVFTVTATLGGGETAAVELQSNQKTVTITVKSASTAEPGGDTAFTAITEPQAGTEYYMGMKIGDNAYHYVNGTFTDNGFYLNTTTDIATAKKASLTASGDGWVIMIDGKYLELEETTGSDGTGNFANPKLKDSQTEGKVWTWDEQYKIFTWGDAKWFLGTRNDQKHDTIGGCAYKYVAQDYLAVIGTYAAEKTDPPAPGPEGGGETKVSGSFTITPEHSGLTSSWGQGKWTDINSDPAGYTLSGVAYGTAVTAQSPSYMQFNGTKPGSYFMNTVATPAPLTKIEVKCSTSSSSDLYLHLLTSTSAYQPSESGGNPSDSGTVHEKQKVTGEESTLTWEITGADTFFALYFEGKNAKVFSIKITYGDAAAEAAMEAPAMTAFTSNANGGLFRKKD